LLKKIPQLRKSNLSTFTCSGDQQLDGNDGMVSHQFAGGLKEGSDQDAFHRCPPVMVDQKAFDPTAFLAERP
jgi:hypothetical protein